MTIACGPFITNKRSLKKMEFEDQKGSYEPSFFTNIDIWYLSIKMLTTFKN
jgi:hypothetical protein